MVTTDRGGAQRAGDVVSALFGASGGKRLSEAQLAARAWYMCNGDRERQHTCGVWMRKSGRVGIDPVLVVRLDSNLLAQELGTNKDLYLARLSRAGVHVSDVRFVAGQRTRSAERARSERAAPPPPRELTQAERERVAAATAHLPEPLQKSVSRAMCATMARNS